MDRAAEYANSLTQSYEVPEEMREAFDWYQDLVKGTDRWLRTGIEESVRKKLKNTPVVVTPTGGLNAYASRVPGSATEGIVIIEFKFLLALQFVTELGIWVASRIPSTFDKEIGKLDTEELAAVAKALQDLFDLPLGQPGQFRDPGFVFGSAPHEVMVMMLSTCIAFIIGHEYAHISLGHLKDAATRSIRLGATQIDVLEYDQAREFEADEKGYRWVTGTVPQGDVPLHAAPLFCCSWFGYFDKIRESLGENPATSSHPHGFDRFGNLYGIIGNDLSVSENLHALQLHSALLQAWEVRPS